MTLLYSLKYPFYFRKEMKYIKFSSYLRAIFRSCVSVLNRTAVFSSIVVYVLTGSTLTASYAFTASSFYRLLNGVTALFPVAISQFAEMLVSVKRIKQFLMFEEITFDKACTENGFRDLMKDNSDAIKPSLNSAVSLKKVSVKWLKTMSDNSLENITLDAEDNDLIAIVGPVGSGKSTLLHVILQEVPLVEGTLKVCGTISYASQEPWLFGASVRQNILFGDEYDGKKYKEVVKVCALERDFTLFPHGDKTLVGERGVSLSGGQRARINLARAVYKEADIYLLDDPLSAVDTHVGKQLFEDCICGYLKDKCVFLVTHQLQYLKNLAKIILLKDGHIQVSGSYKDLMNSDSNFAKMLDDDVEEEQEESDHKDQKLNVTDGNDNGEQKMASEEKGTGSISWHVYKSYINTGGHWIKCVLLALVFLLSQALDSSSEYFVTFW